MTLRVGSLFSGIGGLDLGLERAGMNVIWQSEIDPYACRVLAKHWPAVPNLGDVTKIDWSEVERPDLICGGYPCQPFSTAGLRQGADDPRHLWPYMLRSIRVLRPRYALMENVPGHLSLGFGRVLGDLAESGYDVEWDCISASAVGAPHRRDRVFIVAHSDVRRRWQRDASQRCVPVTDKVRDVPHANGAGSKARSRNGVGVESSAMAGQSACSGGTTSNPYRDTTDGPAIARGERGQWSVEPDVGRVAHGVPSRVDRLRCLGNAVVPQVAELIGRRILAAHAQEVAA